MKIKRKTISKKAAGASVSVPPTSLIVGNNTYKERDNVIEIPQTVNSITDGVATYIPDQDGRATVPTIPRSVTVNNSTYMPDADGDIDLGTIGGGGGAVNDVKVNGTSVVTAGVANVNAATSVSQNGTSTDVDAAGNVDLGNVVKSVKYFGSSIVPDSSGEVTIDSVAGYFAVDPEGLSLYASTLAPTGYDVTTHYIRYGLESYAGGGSLSIYSHNKSSGDKWSVSWKYMIEGSRDADNVVHARLHVEVVGRGDIPSAARWTISYYSYNAYTQRVAIAIKGLDSAPAYWTANDMELRQGSYSDVTGWDVAKILLTDTTRMSSQAFIQHDEPFRAGVRHYVVEFTGAPDGTFTFVSFSEYGLTPLSVTFNGATYTPDVATRNIDLGTVRSAEYNVITSGASLESYLNTTLGYRLSCVCIRGINYNSPTWATNYHQYRSVIIQFEVARAFARIEVDPLTFQVVSNTTAVRYISVLDNYSYIQNLRAVTNDMRMWLFILWDEAEMISIAGANYQAAWGFRRASSAPKLIYPVISYGQWDTYHLALLTDEVGAGLDASVIADSFAAVTGPRASGLVGHYCHQITSEL